MASFEPFHALRPTGEDVKDIACLPYDVLSDEDVRRLCKEPRSFVHVIRSEGDLAEDCDPYSQEVYDLAAASLAKMKEEGLLQKDSDPAFYIYREEASDHTQTGIVGCASVSDYRRGIVRKHELTVKKKEDDRTNHIVTVRAQTGPVFLTFPDREDIAEIIKDETAKEPLYRFEKFGVIHTLWKVSDPLAVKNIMEAFASLKLLYIADGHHRAASSARASELLKTTEANRFMAVAFPAGDLSLRGYHRYVKDLNGKSEGEFLAEVKKNFDVEMLDNFHAVAPERPHEIIMTINSTWYRLVPHKDIYDPDDSISRLDVSILQNSLLEPILGIKDPRTDSRIRFIGGARAYAEVEQLCARADSVGFLLYPTDIRDLMAVADDERIMPPKSTWFEPKLLSGLLVHEL